MCEDKITEIHVTIDDFNQLFEKEIKQLRLESSSKKRNNYFLRSLKHYSRYLISLPEQYFSSK